MNLLRQTTQIPTEQMHNFLKDKNAWENAISMYQGPDPLDHWYNYICWYENQRHGDTEYRQTLERCLSIFEHTDYYKQDIRMVRLWLKYIDMQPNPLHFYQVLHTRGVGKQIAAFYISWANYYESVNALKEAEAVFNVAFKEKAQSYAELHHAHTKFIYAHTNSAPTPAAAASSHQTNTQPQQYDQIVHQNSYGEVAAVHRQQQAQTQAQFQLQQQPQMAQPAIHHNVNPSHVNPQVQHYRQQVVYQQQAPEYQQSTYAPRVENNTFNSTVNPVHYHVHNHPQSQQHQIHQQLQKTQINNQQTTYLQHQLSQPLTPPTGVPVEQQLPATTHHIPTQNQPLQQQSQFYLANEPQRQEQNRVTNAQTSIPQRSETTPAREIQNTSTVGGIRLPKKFANYSRNNYETWKPALFLEEPEDPLRKCHYKKQQVYPDGANVEFSPEELHAVKYLKRMQIKTESEASNTNVSVQNLEQLKNVYDQQQPEQQEKRVFQQISSYSQVQQNVYISSSNNAYELTERNGAGINDTSQAEDDEEEEEEEDEQENDEDEEEYDDEDDYIEATNGQVQLQQQQNTVVNTLDDLEDQIEASTIRFSMHSDQQGVQNKTIKIKFRKEPTQNTNNSLNHNKSFNGSYTVSVQDVYQNAQEKQSYTKANTLESRRNGHNFHPYMMNQTSTPKTSSGSMRHHSRTKLKKVSKFTIATGSSSNSSSAENVNGAIQNGHKATSVNTSFNNATFNDNANYSFSSAAALDNSNCSLTSAVDRLNFRDTTFGGMVAGNTSKLNSTIADFSIYQENSYFATQHDTEAKERRLKKALDTIKTHFEKPSVDPFNSELCRALLTKLDFPNSAIEAFDNSEDNEALTTTRSNLKIVQTPLPKLSNTRVLHIPEAGNMQFNIDKEVGRGSYGSVYKATDVNTGTIVALKYQKPPNSWEIYICDQVLKRIKSPSILPGLMDISTAIIAPNASLIATEFSPFGSLLDINNKIRQNTTKVMHESLVMHFSAQICNIIYHLHQQKIIHADIKPDNFLLMRVPSTDTYLPSLRLIDFGCAIDMTLFPDPDKQKFRKVIQTDGFTCIEMQEGRDWSYETDIFCIAGTIHVMLFGEYMQVQKRADVWDIKQKLPRYLKKHVWTKFFGEILNIKNGKLPDLKNYYEIFDEEANRMDSELQKQIRTLSNILYRR